MKRSLILFALPVVVLGALMASCSDTPTSTNQTILGEVTLAEFVTNPAYNWYQTGYDAYPQGERQGEFNAATSEIRNVIEGEEDRYEVLMVIKPNCGCQQTQIEMPRVMKALDVAGFPQQNIRIFVTDTRLAGIDDVKAQYGVQAAPAFIVLRDGSEIGRIVEEPAFGSSVEEDLATIFTS